MNILTYSYKKRGAIEFTFDIFPHSKVLFYPIKTYYFIRTVRWNAIDPVVTRRDLEAMELVANAEMGTLEHYQKRKGYRPIGVRVNK